MQVSKKDLGKAQIELIVELSVEEMAPYIEKGAQKVSEEVKIEGFRPGKVPFDILKQKIGEMTILEEAANIAVRKTIDEAIEKNTMERQAIGQPEVSITKLAPNNPFEYKVVLSILPTVALGKYKDLNIKIEEAKLEKGELDKAIAELREMRAQEKITDRAAEIGDKAVVDIKMFLNKVPVEDGEHKELAVMLGKDYLVPGFDKKIVGMKKGEERKFELPYPDNHHMKNLAGKMVEFEVIAKEIYSRELPELNDEFATFFRMKDLAELKKNLEESILHERKHKVDSKNEAEMVTKIIDDTKFGDLPEVMVQSELKNMLAELEQSVVRQGGKFEDYLEHLKKDRASLMFEMSPNAIKRVKSALVIREIAVIEKIAATEHEVMDKIEDLKKEYVNNKEVLKMFQEHGYVHYLQNVLTNEKVITKLKEWNYAPVSPEQKS
jgi:trigger factor